MKKTKDAHFWIFFGFLPDFTRRAKITPEMVKMLVLLAVKFSFIFFYSTTIHWKMCCTIEQSCFLAETIKIAEQPIALSVVLLEQLTPGGKLYYSDST